MFWIFQLIFILYGLYCFTFCMMVFYTSIIEEWCCRNRIHIYIQRRRYQQINETSEINLV